MPPSILSQRQKHSFLHAFCVNPDVTFQGQLQGETVVLILRAHPITQLPWIITSIIIAILPVFFTIPLAPLTNGRQFFFINFFWYSFLFSYVFLNILMYLFNVGIVTTKRVVDIDYNGILHKELTASPLGNIEDVTVKEGGFIESFFNFGDVFVQTAGTELNIEFIKIPEPQQAAKIINSLTTP